MKVELLLNAFARPYTFYILGAGASAGRIPTTKELGKLVVEQWLKFGSYPVEPSLPDEVYKRIIGSPHSYSNFQYEPLSRDKLIHFPNPAVHAAIYQKLSPGRLEIPPPQYKVFSLARIPAVILSMNVDGLAKRYCQRHIVFEMHGNIPSEMVHSPTGSQMIDSCMEWGVEIRIPGVLLPQPEPKDITAQKCYQEAARLFPLAQWVVFIGYSFGTFHNTIDDIRTFKYIRKLLRTNPKPVVVIDPNPEMVVGLIQEGMEHEQVFSISAYWNYLSQALIETISLPKYKNPTNLFTIGSKVWYRYNELLDRVG